MQLRPLVWVSFIITVFYHGTVFAQFTNVAVAPINKAVAKDGGVAWGDLNNDGFLDLIMNTNNGNNVNGHTRIFLSNGAVTWTDITNTNAAQLLNAIAERSVMTGDIDGDGDLDFMRSTASRIEVYTNNGVTPTPSFTITQLIQASFFTPNGMNNEGLAWMDFDGDGDLDVYMENHQYGMDILQNDGTGTFTHYTPDTSPRGFPTGGSSGDYSVTTDLDNDGHIDIVARRQGTSSNINEVDIFVNNGDGTFTDNNSLNLQTVNAAKGGVAVADFDNDGDFDYIWTNNGNSTAANTVTVVEQDGVGTLSFSQPTVTVTAGDDGTLTAMPANQNIEGVAAADVNNDGKIDVFLAAASGTSYLLLNNSSGPGDFNFIHDNSGVANTSINPINVSADGEGLAFADYDNDGDMDFYLNINGGANQLWQNNITGSPANYIKVVPKLDLGSGVTVPAIGATVIVSDGCEIFGGIQEVSGGVGHGCQNENRLHFGLPNGNSLLYKVEVGFVTPNGGSRTVVTKFVTPSSLTNQTLTVLDTDVSDANRQPSAVDDNANTAENTLVSIPVLSNDSDPMGETLTLAILTNPGSGTAVINGNNIDYTPDPGFFGTETFTYTITNTSGLCDIGTINVTVTAPFLPGYDCRKPITVNASEVSGSSDLSAFPMLVNFTDADLATLANGGDVTNANGYDIVFTQSDGTTQLDHEILSYTATSGAYLAFVKVNTLSATVNTQIFMYYGNSAVSADPTTTATWDANYQAVLHLQESGNGSDNEFLDATANAHHGTGGGLAGSGSAAGTPTRTTGKFGFAQDFNDATSPQNHIRLNAVNDGSWTAVTVQAWINADDTGDDRIFGKSWGTSSSAQTWLLRKNSANIGVRLRTNTNTNTGFDPFGYSTGTWYLAAASWDAADNQLRVFVNGVQQGSTTLNGTLLYQFPSVAEPTIGNTSTVNRGFDGLLQEARVSDIARNADWLLTEYNNQNDPASFYTVGAEDCSGVLAITLLDFDAVFDNRDRSAYLTWTASYDDPEDQGFQIQRSWDAQEWVDLDFVAITGTLNEVIPYDFRDTQVTNYGRSQAFYRLKMLEGGGQISFSDIQRISFSPQSIEAMIYPNPVTDHKINIRITGSEELPRMDLIHMDGKHIIQNLQLSSPEQEITVPSISPGVYVVRLHSRDFISYRKIVIL